jgi:hypothetical protein
MARYSVRQVWPFLWSWRVSDFHRRVSGLALTKAGAKRAAAAAADHRPRRPKDDEARPRH